MPKIITRKEARKRKMKFQIAAGMADFIGILVGSVVIVICVVLLVSLYHWVIRTGMDSFEKIWDILSHAIIVPD